MREVGKSSKLSACIACLNRSWTGSLVTYFALLVWPLAVLTRFVDLRKMGRPNSSICCPRIIGHCYWCWVNGCWFSFEWKTLTVLLGANLTHLFVLLSALLKSVPTLYPIVLPSWVHDTWHWWLCNLVLSVDGDASWIGLVPLGHICSFIFGSYNTFFKEGIF